MTTSTRRAKTGQLSVTRPVATSRQRPTTAETGRPDALADRLGITKRDLAETVGLAAATLQRKDRASAPATVARLSEMSEIIDRVTPWAGGERQALGWYRGQPLAAFGDRTAESLVKSGEAGPLRDYLDHLALGGFA